MLKCPSALPELAVLCKPASWSSLLAPPLPHLHCPYCVQGSRATVLVLDFHREVDVSLATLKLAAPKKGDEVHTHTHTHTHSPSLFLQVKVLSGADKDSVGSLLSVDEGDGIVRVKATGEVKYFKFLQEPS